MLRMTLMLSSGSGGRPRTSRFSAFILWSSSKPPRVHCKGDHGNLNRGVGLLRTWHWGLLHPPSQICSLGVPNPSPWSKTRPVCLHTAFVIVKYSRDGRVFVQLRYLDLFLYTDPG